MATSTGKTIGLILLAALLILFVVRVFPFFLMPLGVFLHTFKSIRIPNLNGIEYGPFGFFHVSPLSLISLAMLIIWIFVIVWVYKDAEKRGMNGILWALLVFIGNLIGLLIYLIVRSDTSLGKEEKREIKAPQPCPKCGEPVAGHFVFCPNCGTRLQHVCPKCSKPAEENWQVCPNCGGELKNRSG
ncbi:MAG: zinc-ribbon domain-containing protein [Candidatus Aminicenantes bacterium]|nr:zinc-ribbon domain-containing protein [Candidatus Aminicenantes bacterium]